LHLKGCSSNPITANKHTCIATMVVVPPGGNPDSNTLISDMTTVICLDDYHSLDRKGRAEKKVTALAPEAQNFDLMYEQVSVTTLQGGLSMYTGAGTGIKAHMGKGSACNRSHADPIACQ
jgi:hypothetical protein